MIEQLVSTGRFKPCSLCSTPIRKGEPFLQFRTGYRSHRDNLCVKCMHDIALDYYKETWNPPFEVKNRLSEISEVIE